MAYTAAPSTFADREEAGARLAALLKDRDWADPLVLGLARGGVPVAAVVAAELDAALDVAVARKIGAPGRPELAVGAVTAFGPAYYDAHTLRMLDLTEDELEDTCERERAEAQRRVDRYQQGRDPERRAGRDVIVVDDGLATGATATAALRALREDGPRRLVLAAPVCAPSTRRRLEAEADDVVCVAEPEHFMAVGQWYQDFRQTGDEEVVRLLDTARQG